MKGNHMVKSPIAGWIDLRPFHTWCCAVLPTIFDDTMSYYEQLCKVKEIMSGAIVDINLLDKDLAKFKADVAEQFEDLKSGTWIDGTIPYLEKLLEKYIQVAIFFGLEGGHFVAYIPDNWDEINFGTTGYDQMVPLQPEFGHLILNY